MTATTQLDRWAVKWISDNALDGKHEHLCLSKNRELIRIFRTRADARRRRDEEYGYILHRKDLRAEPHGWKFPKVVRVRVVLEELEEPMSSFWTDDRDAELRRLTGYGLSAREAAEFFGCTKNSVLGRRYRLGIKSPMPPNGRGSRAIIAKPPKKPKSAPKPKAAPITAPKPVEAPQAALAPIEEVFRQPVIGGMCLEQLGPRDCRWIDGDPREYAPYCGAETEIGCSYCAAHRRVNHQAPRKSGVANRAR